VNIDGEYARRPLYLKNNTWWIVEGVNVYNSSHEAVAVNDESNNNIIRRVCGWNANPNGTNLHTWLVWNSSDNLFEDICGFGFGRNTLNEFGRSGRNVYRRVWLRWEGWPPNNGAAAPAPAIQVAYATPATSLLENVITVYSAERYAYDPPSRGNVIGGWHFRDAPPSGSPGYRLRGVIVYGYDNPKLVLNHSFFNHQDTPVDIADLYVDATSQGHVHPIVFGCNRPPCTASIAERITSIRGPKASIVARSWHITNRSECTTVRECPDFYTAPSGGARACYRYEDGILSTTPLWPWPMDARINAALARAGSAVLGGGAGPGYGSNTVTSEIVSRFGPIPDKCNGAVSR